MRPILPAALLVLLVSALGCDRPGDIELEEPVGQPAQVPGPDLSPPLDTDTIPMEELPVVREDTTIR